MSERSEVVVVGGGLAGLTAAARLAESNVSVVLLERHSTVGGRVRTRSVDGFSLDRGFQVVFTAYPALQQELDLDALDLRTFKPGAIICRDGSRSTLSDPFRDPRKAVESFFNHEVSFSDKLRTLALRYDLSRRRDDEFFTGSDTSIREYLDAWGFSTDYIENFVAPFYGGITLDRSLSTSKHVFEYTLRSMGAGRIAVPADGMGAIADQLRSRAETAGATIRTDARVNRLEIDEDRDDSESIQVVRFDGTTHTASGCVVATTPPEAKRLTGVDAIPTTGVGCVTQWYTLPAGTRFRTGRRILLNAGSTRPNTVVPLGEVAATYTPDDRTLIAATFVDDAALDEEASTLESETRTALGSWYPERSFEGLESIATDRVEFAQFAQPPGFRDRLPAIDDPDGPVVLAGDHTQWSSLQGAVRSGRRASEAIERHL